MNQIKMFLNLKAQIKIYEFLQMFYFKVKHIYKIS